VATEEGAWNSSASQKVAENGRIMTSHKPPRKIISPSFLFINAHLS